MEACAVPGCDSPRVKRGWCNAHYLRWYRRGDPLSPSKGRPRPRCARCGRRRATHDPREPICQLCITATVPPPNPSGICQCGCGKLAPIAQQTTRKYGWVKGEPLRFIRGHVGALKRRERLTPDLWTLENRGYETRCWLWRGWADNGYARTKFQGRKQLVHRAMYEQEIGPIPAGYDIDHLCFQRSCVNPAHLEAVTRAENLRRARAR